MRCYLIVRRGTYMISTEKRVLSSLRRMVAEAEEWEEWVPFRTFSRSKSDY